MERSQLEHILRAAAGITGGREFVVIGSQALHASTDSPTRPCLQSEEADIFSLDSADDADLIDGTIGEGSPFHRTFGYYAHGVGVETASLPAGWRDRLVPIESARTGGAVGRCLEVHDLFVAKLVAGREKDSEFLGSLVAAELIDMALVSQRLDATPLEPPVRAAAEARLRRLFGKVDRPGE